MKHFSKTLLCALTLMSGSILASAEIVEYKTADEIVYSLDTSAGTATLKSLPMKESLTKLEVPDELAYEGRQYKVVAIGEQAAYSNMAYLKTVKIGDNVESIGKQAFHSCQLITDVTFGKSVKEIGYQAFYNCKSLVSPTLPDGLETIGDYAFYNGQNIENVSLPASVKSIGLNPWGGCTTLKKISIGEGATHYAVVDNVLFDKDVTTLITYPVGQLVISYSTPSTTKKIGDNSMRNNYILNNITLNEGLEEIGNGAFNVCRLKGITIPASVTKIGARAFTANPYIGEFKVAEGNKNFGVYGRFLCTKDGKRLIQGLDMMEIQIPDEVEVIAEAAFYSMTMVKKVNLNNVKVVEESAFYSNRQLADLNFGTKLDSIGNMAFMYCTALKELTFPASFRSIGNRQAFLGCTMLEKINFNEGMEELGGAAFMLCTNLKSVKVPGSVKKFADAVFSNCVALETIEFGEGITEVGPIAAGYCSNLKTVKMANTIKHIGSSAFSFCEKVTELNLPESLETVGMGAFQFVPFKELIFPANVRRVEMNSFAFGQVEKFVANPKLEYIGEWAFGTNAELATVELNEGLDSICKNAFANNNKLLKIAIPSSVRYLGDGIVDHCNYISEIICKATTPQELTADPLPAARYDLCKLTVPYGSLKAYKEAPYWKKFTHIIEDPAGVDGIEADNAEISEIYDLSGMRRSELQDGFNIVRYTNGKVKKIFVKK